MSALLVFIIAVFGFIVWKVTAKRKKPVTLPVNAKKLLEEHVAFYRNLDSNNKIQFEKRVSDFLAHVTITGIGVTVEDLDRLLVASGAIIPIFSFPTWRYNNISEVLLYSDTFNKDYQTEGTERNVLGMVGDGALNRQMILSKPSVRASFQAADGHNTVIHEFAHLLDKADGSVDGVPEYLIDKPYITPWLKAIHATISEMKQDDHSDINLYGATNEAEFFAVVTEYFFERPDELKEKHPELYALLQQMFVPH